MPPPRFSVRALFRRTWSEPPIEAMPEPPEVAISLSSIRAAVACSR
jgi:hypothetical protein